MNIKHILIIEPDKEQQNYLSKILKEVGDFDIKMFSDYNLALAYLEAATTDLLIANYTLEKKNSINILQQKNSQLFKIPCIIYDARYDENILKEILSWNLIDFLPKKMSSFELKKSLLLGEKKESIKKSNSQLFNDYIFVRAGKDIKKLKISDIVYVSVDGKYIELHTADRRFLVRSSMSLILEKLPKSFEKIHKAYAVNLEFLDTINVEDSTVKVGSETLPLSRTYRKSLLDLFYVS